MTAPVTAAAAAADGAAAGGSSSRYAGGFQVQRPLAVSTAGSTAAAAGAGSSQRGGTDRSSTAAAAMDQGRLEKQPALSAIAEGGEDWEGSRKPAAVAARAGTTAPATTAAAAAACPAAGSRVGPVDSQGVLVAAAPACKPGAGMGSRPPESETDAGPCSSRGPTARQQQQPQQQQEFKGQPAQQQQQEEEYGAGEKAPRSRATLSTSNLALWTTSINAWSGIKTLFEDHYLCLQSEHEGIDDDALHLLWTSDVREVCELLLAAHNSIDLDIGGKEQDELVEFARKVCDSKPKSLKQLQVNAAKRLQQQKSCRAPAAAAAAAAGGSSSEKDPVGLREADKRMEHFIEKLCKLSELLYIKEEELTFNRVIGGTDNLTGQARVMDYTNKSGETIELVVKSVPVLVVGADGREVDEEVMALLPEAMGTMELVGYQEVAGEFLICNVMRDYRLLGAYGGSWSRHAIKVQGGDATGAYLYTVELVLPHRGLDVQCWKEQLWECPLFKMLTLPTQRLLLSNSAWRVAEKVAQLLAWLHAAGVIHYDVKGPNIALLASGGQHLLQQMGHGVISLLDAGSMTLARPIRRAGKRRPEMMQSSVRQQGTRFMLAPMQADKKLQRNLDTNQLKPKPTDEVAKLDAWLLGYAVLLLLIVEHQLDPAVSSEPPPVRKGLLRSKLPQQVQEAPLVLTPQELQQRIAAELKSPGAAAEVERSENMWLHAHDIPILDGLLVEVDDETTREQVAARSKELLDVILDRCTQDLELRQFIRDAMHPNEKQRPSCQQLAERAALICRQRGIPDLLQAAGQALQAI